MYHYKTDNLTKKQQYKFLSGSIVPRPVAWISSLNKEGNVINLAPFSFFSGASNELPLITVTILRKDEKIKDTAQNILDRQEAVVHIVSGNLKEEMNQTSSLLPPEESELSLTDLSIEESRTISVPAVKEAKIRFETTLYQHVPIKDEADKVVSDLFILKITDFYFAEDVFDTETEYILPAELDPVARLSGNNYAALGKSYQMIRPDK